MISRTCLFAAFAAAAVLSASALAQDVMAVAANHYVVRVDNADVRVIENTLAPGQIDPVHTHSAGRPFRPLRKIPRIPISTRHWPRAFAVPARTLRQCHRAHEKPMSVGSR